MNRIIANIDLITNNDKFTDKDGTLIAELELAAYVLHACQLGCLFTKKDFKEFITRICLSYGLFNPQETFFNQDYFLSAELKSTGESITLNPKQLIRFIGLIAVEGRLYSSSREDFLNSLINGQRVRIWTEVFSPFKIHRWEDKVSPKGQIVISESANTPEINTKIISNAEAFAEFITKDIEDKVFSEFRKKNRSSIMVFQAREWEVGSIKFDIKGIQKDFLKDFIIALRGEEYFDENAFRVYDEEEYDFEFKLMKLAWAIASGYAEYVYDCNQPMDLRIDRRVDFDYDDYEGMHNDDFGGINLLQTYVDYGLESVVICLQEIAPLIEGMKNNPSA